MASALGAEISAWKNIWQKSLHYFLECQKLTIEGCTFAPVIYDNVLYDVM